jgi:hypothetical protein
VHCRQTDGVERDIATIAAGKPGKTMISFEEGTEVVAKDFSDCMTRAFNIIRP